MEKFTTLTSVAAPLPVDNVDTDQIIPAQFLKTIKRTGLSKGLFYSLRHDAEGNRQPFILDEPAYQGAQILVVGKNFGCGSSREHAPWALLDHGIRCVIGESFADIFHNNCFKNGILPIKLPAEEIAKLTEIAGRGQNARLVVDLESETITTPDGETIAFKIDPFRRHCLLNGLDDIGLTLEQVEEIAGYESKRSQSQPWL